MKSHVAIFCYYNQARVCLRKSKLRGTESDRILGELWFYFCNLFKHVSAYRLIRLILFKVVFETIEGVGRSRDVNFYLSRISTESGFL